MMQEQKLDCAVIGGGPAGLSAAVNLRQRGKTVRVLGAAPGLLAKAEQIDNYLGLPGLTGAALLEAFAAHARSLGIEAEEGRVANLMPLGDRFLVNFGGDILDAGSLILACGVSKAPPVPGEAELLGRGVSYCATCDGMLYRGKPVVVWGLAPDAAHEANFLAGIGCPVTFVATQRPPELNPAVTFVPGGVRQVLGTEHVEGVRLTDQTIPCEGVFILRASIAPDTLLPGLATENGFVTVDRQMATNLPGVFAAGDITGTPLQVAKAVGEGLTAALSAARWLDQQAAAQP